MRKVLLASRRHSRGKNHHHQHSNRKQSPLVRIAREKRWAKTRSYIQGDCGMSCHKQSIYFLCDTRLVITCVRRNTRESVRRTWRMSAINNSLRRVCSCGWSGRIPDRVFRPIPCGGKGYRCSVWHSAKKPPNPFWSCRLAWMHPGGRTTTTLSQELRRTSEKTDWKRSYSGLGGTEMSPPSSLTTTKTPVRASFKIFVNRISKLHKEARQKRNEKYRH